MNQKPERYADPSFDIAMYDTDDSDLSVEAMEAAHESVEEQRAAHLGGSVLSVAQPNKAILQSFSALALRLSIEGIRYKSELKTLSGALTMALARGQISNEEYHILEDEFIAKKTSFEHGKTAVVLQKEWSPSDVLDTMPVIDKHNDPRWRQLPSGDKE